MNVVVETPEYIIRCAESLKEARDFWWPHMMNLGWNRDPTDAQTHFSGAHAGKNWFFLVPKVTGKPEGMIVSFIHSNQTGWVGFFIVSEQFRGRGWGAALFRAAMGRFQENSISPLGLDGVEEQVKTYERRGFVTVGKLNLLTRPSLHDKPLETESQLPLEEGLRVVDIRDMDGEKLADFDYAHVGFHRPTLWSQESLLSRPDAFGFALLSAFDKITGLVLVRRCEHGHRFGPLLADSPAQASALLRAAMAKASGEFIAEGFGDNPETVRIFEELGWENTGINYHRMWYGGKMPEQQSEGGRGRKGMFAIFDASQG